MGALWRDIRYGFRMLVRNPGFVSTAVLVLALGIGVNISLFSIVNTLLFRLPTGISDKEELVRFENADPASIVLPFFSYPYYDDLSDLDEVFLGIAAESPFFAHLEANEQGKKVYGTMVSGNYFDVLGVKAQIGRVFSPEENRVPGMHPVAVISYSFWHRLFDGEPSVLGRPVTLNQHHFTIVGVAPERFAGTGLTGPIACDVWVPLMMQAAVEPSRGDCLTSRKRSWLSLIGRLNPGTSLEQAKAAVDVRARQILEAYPNFKLPFAMTVIPLKESYRRMARGFVPGCAFLLGLAGLVLVITCANVANLLLARATTRQQEMAVRLSLGAGRLRLIRQLLIENLLLSFLGTTFGFILTFWTTSMLSDLVAYLASNTPFRIRLDLSPDIRVSGLTVLLAVVTGIIFGLSPALLACRTELVPVLKGQSSGRAHGTHKFAPRNLLIIGQVTSSFILLIMGGLFVRTFQRAQSIDVGFEPKQVLSMPIDFQVSNYSEHQARAVLQQIVERTEAFPGVSAISFARHRQGDESTTLLSCGRADSDESFFAHYNIVEDNYFQTLKIQLLSGRDFTELDARGKPVVIINETLADKLWTDENPVGQHLKIYWLTDSKSPYQLAEVIGVANDCKYLSLHEQPRPYVYLPFSQKYCPVMCLFIRTEIDEKTLISALRSELKALDKNLPVFELKSFSEHLKIWLFLPCVASVVLGTVGLLGLLLTSFGLYSVTAYLSSQRTHEFGIRMALGAQTRDVLQMVIKQGLILTLIGVAVGLAASFALTRVISSVLYNTSPTDPVTFVCVSLLLAAVALLACYIPARRATKIDPMSALRYE